MSLIFITDEIETYKCECAVSLSVEWSDLLKGDEIYVIDPSKLHWVYRTLLMNRSVSRFVRLIAFRWILFQRNGRAVNGEILNAYGSTLNEQGVLTIDTNAFIF